MRSNLILWRHAEAVELRAGDPSNTDDDLARALTPKGERQAQRVARWLNQQLPAGTRVLVSPARRTQQTAHALDRPFKTEPALAPGGSVGALLAAARWPDAREPVLVVGHQPTLGIAAASLMTGRATGQAQDWSLRKGGLFWLRARERDGVVQVVLHAAIGPDLL